MIDGFNNLLDHSSSLKGYVRTRQQHKVAKYLSHPSHSPMEDPCNTCKCYSNFTLLWL